MSHKTLWLGALAVLALATVCVQGASGADNTYRAIRLTVGPTANVTAEKVLQSVADYYSHLKSATFTAHYTLTLERNGKKTVTSCKYDAGFMTPNYFYMVPTEGQSKTIYSDGSQITVYDSAANEYSIDKAPGRMKDALSLASMSAELHGFDVILGLHALTLNELSRNFFNGALSFEGSDTIDNIAVNHVKIAAKDHELHIWSAADGSPLIYRILIVTTKAQIKSTLSFNVDYTSWTQNPALTARSFEYRPPYTASKIPSVTERLARGPHHPLEGQPAPRFALDLLNGGTMDIADKKGSVVVLDFWATWCPPCRRAMPIIAKVASRYSKQGVEFYAVNLGEQPDSARRFLQQAGLDVNVALDRNGRVAELYEANSIPQTVIIGRDGRVSRIHVGMTPNLESELDHELRSALGSTDG